MRTLQWPRPLCQGDRVALIAPASPAPRGAAARAAEGLRSLGLIPELFPSCTSLAEGGASCFTGSAASYLSGSDALRASDLLRAFTDDHIRGIFCLRGGYGSMRLLPLLDFQEIRKHPKVFCGFSDITALHIALQQKCGFITFHGPMPQTDYRALDDYSRNSLQNALFRHRFSFKNPPEEPLFPLFGGEADGILTGGNLTLIQSLQGSPYALHTEKKILFLEEVNEPTYRIDRMLTSLRLSGALTGLSGILLGTFTKPGEEGPALPDSLLSLFREMFAPLGIPVLAGLSAGHHFPQITLPLGARISFSADSCRIGLCRGSGS